MQHLTDPVSREEHKAHIDGLKHEIWQLRRQARFFVLLLSGVWAIAVIAILQTLKHSS